MRSLPLERPPSAPCASARGAQTHGGDACSRDRSGPGGQSHEELLQCRPGQVCPGSLVHTGLRCHPFTGAAKHPVFFDTTDRRASGPSKPGRRSDRTEGAPLSLPSSGRLAAQGRTRPRWRGDREKRRTREEGRLVRNVSPRGPAVSEPVSYTAVLMVAVETVLFRVAAACRRPLEPGDSGSAAGAGLLPANSAGARWLIDGTRLASWPSWPRWPKTTPSAARRPTGTSTRASTP